MAMQVTVHRTLFKPEIKEMKKIRTRQAIGKGVTNS